MNLVWLCRRTRPIYVPDYVATPLAAAPIVYSLHGLHFIKFIFSA